ncbi:hypothetical protein B0I35DRAFT_475453 [Stachybotrys elegans]|uniref:Uncharacterized protein n=1 Tax=Stachybotrys elegans TaxID=80388 RepID=A0A8K0SWR1_9HYPO|nr:hypothetical protein B0I35DRAFT_475453 [Stachybotrys elegans]
MPSGAPFSSDLLGLEGGGVKEEAIDFSDLLPASVRQIADLRAQDDIPIEELLEQELDPAQLHQIIRHLWLAGRPVPPRPLHFQVLIGREVAVSEQMSLHCVWSPGRIILKPIPRFLFRQHFWREHLECHCGVECQSKTSHLHLRQCALGFLLSYVALIAHESDYSIARAKGLIPEEVTWPVWRRFVREFLRRGGSSSLRPEQLYAEVAPRFIYGELRANRLAMIDKVCNSPFSTRFLSHWASYEAFLTENSSAIIAATAWILLVLSAMQLGLETEYLSEDGTFQAVSWGFTVFSIIAPMSAVCLILIVFATAFIYNLLRTRRGELERARYLRREWRKG